MFNFFLLIISFFLSASSVQAEMSSASYSIPSDVVNVGGISQTSGNYFSDESIGEFGTGEAKSTSYIDDAGFWAMVGDTEVITFNITDSSADLGALDKNVVRYDSAAFSVATTSKNGYVVEFLGDSLSSDSHIISPIATPTGSSPGNEQFGFNLRQNSNPTTGVDPSGGNGQAASGYNSPNAYKFNSGDVIAQANQPSIYTNYTISFIGNITGISDAGEYATNLTVIAIGKY